MYITEIKNIMRKSSLEEPDFNCIGEIDTKKRIQINFRRFKFRYRRTDQKFQYLFL